MNISIDFKSLKVKKACFLNRVQKYANLFINIAKNSKKRLVTYTFGEALIIEKSSISP
jgi:hypothetical protein